VKICTQRSDKINSDVSDLFLNSVCVCVCNKPDT
jgi:hypothetical protein